MNKLPNPSTHRESLFMVLGALADAMAASCCNGGRASTRVRMDEGDQTLGRPRGDLQVRR